MNSDGSRSEKLIDASTAVDPANQLLLLRPSSASSKNQQKPAGKTGGGHRFGKVITSKDSTSTSPSLPPNYDIDNGNHNKNTNRQQRQSQGRNINTAKHKDDEKQQQANRRPSIGGGGDNNSKPNNSHKGNDYEEEIERPKSSLLSINKSRLESITDLLERASQRIMGASAETLNRQEPLNKSQLLTSTTIPRNSNLHSETNTNPRPKTAPIGTSQRSLEPRSQYQSTSLNHSTANITVAKSQSTHSFPRQLPQKRQPLPTALHQQPSTTSIVITEPDQGSQSSNFNIAATTNAQSSLSIGRIRQRDRAHSSSSAERPVSIIQANNLIDRNVSSSTQRPSVQSDHEVVSKIMRRQHSEADVLGSSGSQQRPANKGTLLLATKRYLDESDPALERVAKRKPSTDSSQKSTIRQHNTTNESFKNDQNQKLTQQEQLNNESRLQGQCAAIIGSRLFPVVTTLIIFFNWVLYTTRYSVPLDSIDRQLYSYGESWPRITVNFEWQDYFLFLIFVFYTYVCLFNFIIELSEINNNISFELTMKMIASGNLLSALRLWRKPVDKRPLNFFTSMGNRMDFVIVLAYWVDFWMQIGGAKDDIFIFRAISSLRPLRLLYVSPGLAAMAQSLVASGPLLKNVAIFLGFFYLYLGMIGIHFLRGSLHRRCVVLPLEVAIAGNYSLATTQAWPVRSCGGWVDQLTGETLPPLYGDDRIPWGSYICPSGQLCKIIDVSIEPPNGFVSFDQIFMAMFSIFQSSSEQGWTQTAYLSMDAEGSPILVYHILVMFIISFVLMNMLVAVIVETFSTVHREYQEKRQKQRKSREILQPSSYAASASVTAAGIGMESGVNNIIIARNNTAVTSSQAAGEVYRQRRRREKYQRLMQSIWFRSLQFTMCCLSLLTIVLHNTVADATEDPAYRQRVITASWTIDGLVTAWFWLELWMLWTAVERLNISWKLSTHKDRLLDIINALVSTVIILPSIYMSPWYRYLSLFQVLRFYKVATIIPRIPRIIRTAFGNVVDLANAMLFFLMIMAILATIGMQIFGGRLRLDPARPEATWDTFVDAFLTTFIIMVSDNWTTPMFNGLYYYRDNWVQFTAAAVFFIIAFSLMHSIVISMTVAVILQNFELTEDEKRYGQVFQLVESFEKTRAMLVGQSRKGMSRWNPYRYLPPSPSYMRIPKWPERLQPRIRTRYFKQFMQFTGPTEENMTNADAVLGPNRSSSSPIDWTEKLMDQINAGWRKTLGFMRRLPLINKLTGALSGDELMKPLAKQPPKQTGTQQQKKIAATAELLDDSMDSLNNLNNTTATSSSNAGKNGNNSTVKISQLSRKQLIRLVGGYKIAAERVKLDQVSKNPNIDVLNACQEEREAHRMNDYYTEQAAAVNDFKEDHPTYNKSYFIFAPTSRLRQFCWRLAHDTRWWGHRLFRYSVFISIVISSIILAMDTPLQRRMNLNSELDSLAATRNLSSRLQLDVESQDGPVAELLRRSEYLSPQFQVSEYLFASLFTVELIVLTIADGVVFTPKAYLNDPWHWMDVLVLICMWIGVSAKIVGSTGGARLVRALRALRPMRLITFIPSLRSIYDVVLACFNRVLESIVLALLFMIPYAVYGMNLFYRRLYYCNDASVSDQSQCVGSYVDPQTGLLMPRQWADANPSFATLGSSLLFLFELLMEEGWSAKFYSIMQTDSIGQQPQWPPPAWQNGVYAIVWMLFGFVLLRNLYVGILLQTFMTRDGTALLTADQRRWLDVQRKLKLVRPTKRTQRPQMNEYGGWLRRSSDRCRLWCFEMVRDKAGRFAQFITATLFLNFAVMLSEFQTYGRHDYSDGTWDMTNEPTQPVISASREYLYMLFTVIYVCEALIKLLGLGWRKWATSRYNLFDTCLLAILLPVMFVLLLAGNQSFSAARLEAVRLLQKVLLDLFILKLVQRIRILKMLFRTVAASFLSILNIIGVLLVVFSAYALMMVEVFGLTRHQLATSPHANFRSFGTALLTLFRMTTGETWNQIFHEIAVEWPNCVENPNTYLLTDCGSTTWSFVLVLSFEILITLFLMNLFVVSVIDNFDFSYQQDAVFSLVTMEDLNNYKQAWAEFDPNATGYIPRQELLKFLRKLGGNFEVKIYDDDVQLTNLLPKISSGGTVAPQRSRPNSTVGAVKDELQPHKFNNNIPVNISTNKRQSLSSTPPSTKVTSVDISKLNSALSGMDPKTTRRRRQLFNFIYQEAVSFEEPQRGIPFDKLLRVLAYKLVDAEQFLRIDQMFQRQHQMNRIQRLVYEEKVRSLLNTIVLRKRYRRLLASTHQQDPLVSTQQTVHSSRAPNPLLNRLKPGVVQGSNTSIDRHSRSQLNNFTAVGGMSLLGRPMASGVGGGRQQHVLGRRPQSSSYSVAKSATSLISAVDSDDSQSLSKVPLDDSTINQQQQTIWDNSDTTAMDAVCDNYWTDLL